MSGRDESRNDAHAIAIKALTKIESHEGLCSFRWRVLLWMEAAKVSLMITVTVALLGYLIINGPPWLPHASMPTYHVPQL